jgi:hypothetical protein
MERTFSVFSLQHKKLENVNENSYEVTLLSMLLLEAKMIVKRRLAGSSSVISWNEM